MLYFVDKYGMSIVLLVGAIIFILALTAGCADHRPSCADNPRNMQCMTAPQLERELNK